MAPVTRSQSLQKREKEEQLERFDDWRRQLIVEAYVENHKDEIEELERQFGCDDRAWEEFEKIHESKLKELTSGDLNEGEKGELWYQQYKREVNGWVHEWRGRTT